MSRGLRRVACMAWLAASALPAAGQPSIAGAAGELE